MGRQVRVQRRSSRRPGLVLLLCCTAIILAAAVFFKSSAVTATAAVWSAGASNFDDGLRSACLKIRKYAGDEAALGPNCSVPLLNISGLQEYGCKILDSSCFDQHRIIVYNPPDDLAFNYPFADTGFSATLVPGWTKLNKSSAGPVGVGIAQPLVRKNSSDDRPDQMDPIFSSCHTPIVWTSPYHNTYGEFFQSSFVPLWYMQSELKLIDRNIMLTPLMDGYRKPQFMENLLRPYSNKMILPFNDVSSREHMFDPTFPRCFEKVAMCNLKDLYTARPPRKFHDKESNLTIFDGDKTWTWYKPGQAGKALVDYYRHEGNIPPFTKDQDTLQVVVGKRTDGYREFRNLTVFLERCNEWKPPLASVYKRTLCVAHSFGPHAFFESLTLLQDTDVLIAHHGAELVHGWFMPFGSSVVEVRMKGFPDDWASIYFQSTYRSENTHLYFSAKVVNDDSWEPGAWEKDKQPNHIYALERRTKLRWNQWEPILEAIVAVNRSMELYEKKKWPDDLRWLI
ncbi:hypothetical protein D9Q98_003909 [Chlorella vulgaris]|uniref:Uncharacterized protein n=1 Tax=Chlorella vulgaris TaxID=3077 RepID=A0A9D4TR75_CHLVU|nr:hypothetical protein D9Q98_003909 [Chlorella vulgaris]